MGMTGTRCVVPPPLISTVCTSIIQPFVRTGYVVPRVHHFAIPGLICHWAGFRTAGLESGTSPMTPASKRGASRCSLHLSYLNDLYLNELTRPHLKISFIEFGRLLEFGSVRTKALALDGIIMSLSVYHWIWRNVMASQVPRIRHMYYGILLSHRQEPSACILGSSSSCRSERKLPQHHPGPPTSFHLSQNFTSLVLTVTAAAFYAKD